MQTASISNAIAGATGDDLFSQTAAQTAAQTGAQTGAAATGGAPFAGLLTNAIGSVQNLEDQAASSVQGLMTGQGVDVHQAMIATQKADMSFEMALAVRSKAVAAYQQVMQMQF
ncbi:MAG: flagellar hook-basal body complex protein FliE [Silvibacterium sp.]